MTLRQVWVRILTLLREPSPLRAALDNEAEEVEQQERSAELDDALTRYRKG